LIGHDGTDRLHGDAGNDTLNGLDGADDLWGGEGEDVLNGGAGADILQGNDGADELNGQDGNDSLIRHHDNDSLRGGQGDDTLIGGIGDDSLSGGQGNDQLSGVMGNDTLTGRLGQDVIFGDRGDDWIDGTESGQDATEDTAVDQQDFLNGGGNDTLLAGAGDVVTLGLGQDTMILGSVNAGKTAANIIGFDRQLDKILITYPAAAQEIPVVSLRPNEDNPALTQILVDGSVLATMNTVTDFNAADITLVADAAQ
jgi:Ca2+-binding RTX toxin-like protein